MGETFVFHPARQIGKANASRIAVLRAEIAALTTEPLPVRTPSLHQVITAVAEEFGVTTTMLLNATRAPLPALARHAAMAMLRRLTLLSLPQIGRHMRRDHTTVLHGIRRVEAMAKADPAFAARIDALAARIEQRSIAR